MKKEVHSVSRRGAKANKSTPLRWWWWWRWWRWWWSWWFTYTSFTPFDAVPRSTTSGGYDAPQSSSGGYDAPQTTSGEEAEAGGQQGNPLLDY